MPIYRPLLLALGLLWAALAATTCSSSSDSEPPCDPDKKGSCSSRRFCNDKGVCELCPGGDESYNCDGVGACDSATRCREGACEFRTDHSCRDNEQYCNADSGECEDCDDGFYNCDGENGSDSDEACESSTVCDATCDASERDACKNDGEYCSEQSGNCESCPDDRYNCDGENRGSASEACESEVECCNPDTANWCDDVQLFCHEDKRTCESCGDRYNCDGENGSSASAACEEQSECTTPVNECDPACMDDFEENCRKRDAICLPCWDNNDAMCAGNPRALGPRCFGDTICGCTDSSDCRGRTTGSECIELGQTGVKYCGCRSKSDCSGDYTICDSDKQTSICRKPCGKDEDCDPYFIINGAYECDSGGICQPKDLPPP